MPTSLAVSHPGVPVKASSLEIAVAGQKAFQKGMESGEVGMGFGPKKARDQEPGSGCLLFKPGGVAGGSLAVGPHFGEKAVGLVGLPGIDQIALSPGSFVSEFTDVNAGAPSEGLNPLVFRDFGGAVCLEGAPDRKENPSFGGTVDLKPKVALGESVGHEERTDDVASLGDCDFIVSVLKIVILRDEVSQMNRGTSPPPVEHVSLIVSDKVEPQAGCLGGDDERVERTEGRPLFLGSAKHQAHIAGLGDLRQTQWVWDGFGRMDGHASGGAPDREMEGRRLGHRVARYAQIEGRRAVDVKVGREFKTGIPPFEVPIPQDAFLSGCGPGAEGVAGEGNRPFGARGRIGGES